jgi:hypothetical protein
MKILKAKNYIEGLELQQFKVKELMLLPSEKWLQKRMPVMRESLKNYGMIWPVIVVDHINYWHNLRDNWPKNEHGGLKEGLVVQTGNKRLKFAIEENYDLIEGYFVKSKEEQIQILLKTYIEKELWPLKM